LRVLEFLHICFLYSAENEGLSRSLQRVNICLLDTVGDTCVSITDVAVIHVYVFNLQLFEAFFLLVKFPFESLPHLCVQLVQEFFAG